MSQRKRIFRWFLDIALLIAVPAVVSLREAPLSFAATTNHPAIVVIIDESAPPATRQFAEKLCAEFKSIRPQGANACTTRRNGIWRTIRGGSTKEEIERGIAQHGATLLELTDNAGATEIHVKIAAAAGQSAPLFAQYLDKLDAKAHAPAIETLAHVTKAVTDASLDKEFACKTNVPDPHIHGSKITMLAAIARSIAGCSVVPEEIATLDSFSQVVCESKGRDSDACSAARFTERTRLPPPSTCPADIFDIRGEIADWAVLTNMDSCFRDIYGQEPTVRTRAQAKQVLEALGTVMTNNQIPACALSGVHQESETLAAFVGTAAAAVAVAGHFVPRIALDPQVECIAKLPEESIKAAAKSVQAAGYSPQAIADAVALRGFFLAWGGNFEGAEKDYALAKDLAPKTLGHALSWAELALQTRGDISNIITQIESCTRLPQQQISSEELVCAHFLRWVAARKDSTRRWEHGAAQEMINGYQPSQIRGLNDENGALRALVCGGPKSVTQECSVYEALNTGKSTAELEQLLFRSKQ